MKTLNLGRWIVEVEDYYEIREVEGGFDIVVNIDYNKITVVRIRRKK